MSRFRKPTPKQAVVSVALGALIPFIVAAVTVMCIMASVLYLCTDYLDNYPPTPESEAAE